MAFDEAICDSVDAMSVSLNGFTSSLLNDDMMASSFHVVKQGIMVFCFTQNNRVVNVIVKNVCCPHHEDKVLAPFL